SLFLGVCWRERALSGQELCHHRAPARPVRARAPQRSARPGHPESPPASPTLPRGHMTPTRAILIAAGRGKRLGPHTEELPKCMVQVGARPILGWVGNAFRAAGIEELVVIRGYRGDALEAFARSQAPVVHFVDNPEWQTNNVLLSLACAR